MAVFQPVIGPHIARAGVGAPHVLGGLHAGVGVAGLVALEVGRSAGGARVGPSRAGVGAAQLLVHLPGGGVVGHVLLHHRLHLLQFGLLQLSNLRLVFPAWRNKMVFFPNWRTKKRKYHLQLCCSI